MNEDIFDFRFAICDWGIARVVGAASHTSRYYEGSQFPTLQGKIANRKSQIQ
jgi:hypothetical protein